MEICVSALRSQFGTHFLSSLAWDAGRPSAQCVPVSQFGKFLERSLHSSSSRDSRLAARCHSPPVRIYPQRMKLFLVATCTLSGAASFALSGAATTPRSAALASMPARVAPAAIRAAYNPDPMAKARPKKSKEPKEKVKGPAASTLIAPEQTFFEGPPSMTETLIPGLSLFTVVGVIPFTASLARQAWTRYKITNRRIEVASGFQGKDVVQILWREVYDVKWLRRYGGAAGDIVFTLKDGSKLEMRSVSQFDRNLAYIMSQVDEAVPEACGYPDKPALEYKEKVASGAEPAPVLPPLEATPVAVAAE